MKKLRLHSSDEDFRWKLSGGSRNVKFLVATDGINGDKYSRPNVQIYTLFCVIDTWVFFSQNKL